MHDYNPPVVTARDKLHFNRREGSLSDFQATSDLHI